MEAKISFNSKFNPDGTPLPEGSFRELEICAIGSDLDLGEPNQPSTGGWGKIDYEANNFEKAELERALEEFAEIYGEEWEKIFEEALYDEFHKEFRGGKPLYNHLD